METSITAGAKHLLCFLRLLVQQNQIEKSIFYEINGTKKPRVRTTKSPSVFMDKHEVMCIQEVYSEENYNEAWGMHDSCIPYTSQALSNQHGSRNSYCSSGS
jgi:hypothetical protein